jgi:hypothetical protein
MISKHLIRGTGLAIGASLLSVGQALAVGFTIDSFNNQFTDPFTNSQVSSGANKVLLRTGRNFPTSATNPARITDPFGLPASQVIGGSRDLEMFSIQNLQNLTTSGQSRVFATTPTGSGGFWQVSSSNGSRVSSKMIWDNIDPFAPPTASNSGKFEERLKRGALAFKTTSVVSGSVNPLFQNKFTFTIKDSDGTSVSLSKTGIHSNEFVFFSFEDFEAAAALANLDLNLNAVNYVDLNIETGGGNSSTVRVDFVQGYEIPEPSLVLGCLTILGTGFLSLKGRRDEAEES